MSRRYRSGERGDYLPVSGVLSKLATTAAQNRMHGVKIRA
jgi:hypothetical protein